MTSTHVQPGLGHGTGLRAAPRREALPRAEIAGVGPAPAMVTAAQRTLTDDDYDYAVFAEVWGQIRTEAGFAGATEVVTGPAGHLNRVVWANRSG